MWTTFKVFIEFVTILLLFFFLCFGPKECGILAPWPEIESTLPALEGKVLTTGQPGKSLRPPPTTTHSLWAWLGPLLHWATCKSQNLGQMFSSPSLTPPSCTGNWIELLLYIFILATEHFLQTKIRQRAWKRPWLRSGGRWPWEGFHMAQV